MLPFPRGAAGLPRFNTPYELGRYYEVKNRATADAAKRMRIVTNVDPKHVDLYFSDIKGRNVIRYWNTHSFAKTVRNWLYGVALSQGRDCPDVSGVMNGYLLWSKEFKRHTGGFDMPGTEASSTVTYHELRLSMVNVINKSRPPAA